MVSLAGLALLAAYFFAAVHNGHKSRFSLADLFGETPVTVFIDQDSLVVYNNSLT
jgi:hypothetical protein